jgi:hypothetical protein
MLYRTIQLSSCQYYIEPFISYEMIDSGEAYDLSDID